MNVFAIRDESHTPLRNALPALHPQTGREDAARRECDLLSADHVWPAQVSSHEPAITIHAVMSASFFPCTMPSAVINMGGSQRFALMFG